MTIGLGIFMILSGIFVVVVIGQYAISLLMGAVFMLTGIFGIVAGRRMKMPTRPNSTMQPGVVVEIRCRSCNALNLEGAQFCSKCGNKM